MTLKSKLISCIAMAVLFVCIIIVGVLAIDQQTIKMKGSVVFEVDDPSLYIRDVRIQQSMSDTPTTVEGFMKGFINGEYKLDMSNQTIDDNAVGSFLLYFDIVNLINNGTTTQYKAQSSWTNGEVSGIRFKIREESQIIEAGTVTAENMTDSTPLSGTLVLEVNTNNTNSFDLSNITITLDEYFVPIDTGLSFSLNDSNKTATVTGYTGAATELVIPSSISTQTVDGNTIYVEGSRYTVTAIGNGSYGNSLFGAATNLQHITLPSTLTSIGSFAFQNCTGLTGELVIPSNVTSIGASAFNGCTGFTSLSLPSGLTTLNDAAFNGCSGLTGTLTLPASLTNFGANVFLNCSGFSKLKFEEGFSCNNIGYAAFNGCSGLTGSLSIPASVKTINGYAFYNCTGMTGTLTIPSSVTTINQSAFQNTRFTGTLTIPSSVTTMGTSVFRDSTGFTKVVFEEGLTEIAESVLFNCTGIIEVRIPSTIASIGGSAFYNCTHLATVYVASPTIAGLLTARNACGNLLYNAQTVYVSTAASTSLPSQFSTMFTETTSDVSGYKKYE